MLIYDTATAVRAAVATELADSPALPDSWARELACDVSEVAVPVLRYAQSLSDDDLIAIIEYAEAEKLQVISQRDTVSQRVSGALIQQGDEATVTQLLHNEGAEIAKRSLGWALSRFRQSEDVRRGLMNRQLPPRVLVALVNCASDELRRELLQHPELSAAVRDNVVDLGEEAALHTMLAGQDGYDPAETVNALLRCGKLTDRLLLRVLLEGQYTLFVQGLAARADTPYADAARRIEDGDAFARSGLYRNAEVTERLFNAFNAACSAAQPYLKRGSALDDSYRAKAIADIRASYPGITGDSLTAVLTGLSKTTASAW
nr:DUF2336 domain-containing protein [Rhodovibrio sodomensis]